MQFCLAQTDDGKWYVELRSERSDAVARVTENFASPDEALEALAEGLRRAVGRRRIGVGIPASEYKGID